jgi:hypothetical protein
MRHWPAGALLGATGLALYLWPAFSAPVVLTSDSVLDLDWAARGIGIISPLSGPHHPAKPGYLFFLREAGRFGPPHGDERQIVVIQSLLLWVAIAVTSLALGMRFGPRWAAATYVLLLLFLRIRDVSSAIMSEALSASMFLLIVAALLDPPRRRWSAFLLGVAAAALFLVRPNVGGIAVLLALGSFLLAARRRRAPFFLAGFVALALAVWVATSPPNDALRGLAYPILEASRPYNWNPQPMENVPPTAEGQLRLAATHWREAFAGGSWHRDLVWRAFHGLLGTEFYDARWSPAYRAATTASRILSPFAICFVAALILAAPLRGDPRIPKALGVGLLCLLLPQNLLLGSRPRMGLPFLPGLLALGVACAPAVLSGSRRRLAGAFMIFGALVGATAWQREVLDWEWGVIESTDVRITQTIPPRALPVRPPATLHIRIAAPLLPTDAGLEVLGPGGERLYASQEQGRRATAPFVTFSLPASVLDANRRGAVALTLVATGRYDAFHYLLFPVIPPPWGASAHRFGNDELSPHSGVARGSLDWWARAGSP